MGKINEKLEENWKYIDEQNKSFIKVIIIVLLMKNQTKFKKEKTNYNKL